MMEDAVRRASGRDARSLLLRGRWRGTRTTFLPVATLVVAVLCASLAFLPALGRAAPRPGRRPAPHRPRVAETDASKSVTGDALAWTIGSALPANAARLGLLPLAPADAGVAPSLADVVRRGKNTATVLVFISSRCPYVAAARPVLSGLVSTWGAKVGFVAIASNQNEGWDELKAHAAARDFGNGAFVAYRDEKGALAEALGATHTPEAFVLDGDGFLRYHGGVQDVEAALSAVVAGKAVAKPESRAFGCTIKRRP